MGLVGSHEPAKTGGLQGSSRGISYNASYLPIRNTTVRLIISNKNTSSADVLISIKYFPRYYSSSGCPKLSPSFSP